MDDTLHSCIIKALGLFVKETLFPLDLLHLFCVLFDVARGAFEAWVACLRHSRLPGSAERYLLAPLFLWLALFSLLISSLAAFFACSPFLFVYFF